MMNHPNILWIMTDEQRTDSIGAYGSPWAVTPHLDALAADGVRFSNAYTPSPVCVSARASMLTGRACSSIGVLNNHHSLAPEHARFLPQLFASAGYDVASFGKHHYNCRGVKAFPLEGGRCLGDRVTCSQYLVNVDDVEFGVVRYPGPTVPVRREWLFAGRYPGTIDDTPEMANVRDAVDWLNARDAHRPFFLRLSFNAPHTPVVTPEAYRELIDSDAIELPIDRPGELPYQPRPIIENLQNVAGSHRLTDEEIRRTRQCYYGYVACLDAVVGRLLGRLAELGALENTIVAFVSDHGCHLADQGFYQKQSFYDVSARVPYILAGPGVARGVALDTPVNTGSLLPTLLDLAGVPQPVPLPEFPSHGRCVESGAEPVAAPVFSEIDFGIWDYRDGDTYVMVRDGDWKLCTYVANDGCGGEIDPSDTMVVNIREDPSERQCATMEQVPADILRRLLSHIRERSLGNS